METELHEINVKLSKNQKKRIFKAFHDRETIVLRLKNDALTGSDTLLVPSIKMSLKYIHPYDGREIPISYTFINHLERKRKNEHRGMQLVLDYSLINDSTKEAVTRNIEKLMQV